MLYFSPHPIAFNFLGFPIHWYGLMYIFGFLLAWHLAFKRCKDSEMVSDLISYGALGVIVGGRLGYMIFYDTHRFFHHPMSLWKVWEGGMSFHGGLLGVLVALVFFAHKYQKSYLWVGDFVAPLVPLGLGLGRIGNFMNGELWGRVTSVPWGIVFPYAGPLPRHPSQLYEAFLEGVVLFIILWLSSLKPKPRGFLSGLFLFFYGVFRIIGECFREPDPQWGYLFWHGVTFGQCLSLPMIVVGVWLMYGRRS